jgi:integrase
LRRCDLDFLRSVDYGRKEAQQIIGRGRVVSGPKSWAGGQSLAVPKTVRQALEAHVAEFAQPGPDGVVFTAPRGSAATGASSRRGAGPRWPPSGPPGLHVHDLRHHAATSMARIPGVTTKKLMARIGHSSPRAALIYQHATEERNRAVADVLEAEIGNVQRPENDRIRSVDAAKSGRKRSGLWDSRGIEAGSGGVGSSESGERNDPL